MLDLGLGNFFGCSGFALSHTFTPNPQKSYFYVIWYSCNHFHRIYLFNSNQVMWWLLKMCVASISNMWFALSICSQRMPINSLRLFSPRSFNFFLLFLQQFISSLFLSQRKYHFYTPTINISPIPLFLTPRTIFLKSINHRVISPSTF